ncbi:hypothetical protein ACMFMG_007294 [Clarireedia jacksonii]
MPHQPSKKRDFASYDRDEDEENTVEPVHKVARHHSPELRSSESNRPHTPYRSVINIMLARAINENVNVQMLMKHYVLLQCSEMARRLPEYERLRSVEQLVYKFFWDDGRFPGDADAGEDFTDATKNSSIGADGDMNRKVSNALNTRAKGSVTSSSEHNTTSVVKAEESRTAKMADASVTKVEASKNDFHNKTVYIAKYGPEKEREIYKTLTEIPELAMNASSTTESYVVNTAAAVTHWKQALVQVVTEDKQDEIRKKAEGRKEKAQKLGRWDV